MILVMFRQNIYVQRGPSLEDSHLTAGGGSLLVNKV